MASAMIRAGPGRNFVRWSGGESPQASSRPRRIVLGKRSSSLTCCRSLKDRKDAGKQLARVAGDIGLVAFGVGRDHLPGRFQAVEGVEACAGADLVADGGVVALDDGAVEGGGFDEMSFAILAGPFAEALARASKVAFGRAGGAPVLLV